MGSVAQLSAAALALATTSSTSFAVLSGTLPSRLPS
jgi:hypothetical protein